MKRSGSVVLIVCVGLMLTAGLITRRMHSVHGQQAGFASASLSGVVSPVGTITCDATTTNNVNYTQFTVGPPMTAQFWMCTNLSGSYVWTLVPGTPVSSFQNQDFSVQPGLFATGVLKGTVYYEAAAVTIKAVVSRLEGSPVCTAAPAVVIMDLGTSATTAYGSATALYSQATATSNGAFSNTGLSVSIAAGHYVGMALSAGSCVTPPTISTTITLQ